MAGTTATKPHLFAATKLHPANIFLVITSTMSFAPRKAIRDDHNPLFWAPPGLHNAGGRSPSVSHCFRSMKCIPGGPRDKWTMRNCSRDPGAKFQFVLLCFAVVRVPRHARFMLLSGCCEAARTALLQLRITVSGLHLVYSQKVLKKHFHSLLQVFVT